MATELSEQDDDNELGPRGMIRVIGRGIAVLQALNRAETLTTMEIAELADVPYATAFRIIQTLIAEGMVERIHDTRRYRLTALVQTLSVGYQIEDKLVAVARPYIVELTKKLSWPISVSTRVGTRMMVRDSTHAQTSRAFHIYHPGYTLPILESSSGRTYLSFCPDEERARIMATLKSLDEGVNELPPRFNEMLNIFEYTRKNGYGTHSRTRHTENPGKTSSISTPVFRQDTLVGTLTLIFFASAIPMEDAVKLFVGPMKEAATAVSTELSAFF